MWLRDMFNSFTPYDDNDSVTIVSDFVFEHRKSGDTFNGGNWLTSIGGYFWGEGFSILKYER